MRNRLERGVILTASSAARSDLDGDSKWHRIQPGGQPQGGGRRPEFRLERRFIWKNGDRAGGHTQRQLNKQTLWWLLESAHLRPEALWGLFAEHWRSARRRRPESRQQHGARLGGGGNVCAAAAEGSDVAAQRKSSKRAALRTRLGSATLSSELVRAARTRPRRTERRTSLCVPGEAGT
jgi:hypothetical protein